MIKKTVQNSIFISDPHGEHEEFFRLMNLAKDKLGGKADNIFILGDIFDRGPRPDLIMDYLMNEKASIHFLWGNHDILWMSAFGGCRASIACALRIAIVYNNFDLLRSYKINLDNLKNYAIKHYKYNERFKIKVFEENEIAWDKEIAAKMHEAIAMIQFKLEKGLLPKDRLYLDDYQLNIDEENIIDGLKRDFENSEILKNHIEFLTNNGSIFKVYNNKLLFHACILPHQKKELEILQNNIKMKKTAINFYLLWCGKNSPFFGKQKMTTYERYFFDDKATYKEPLEDFYKFCDDKKFIDRLLFQFGITDGIVINGHIPVKIKDGESPIKCEGLRIVLDGGMAKSYQKVSGIKGMVMIENEGGCTILH